MEKKFGEVPRPPDEEKKEYPKGPHYWESPNLPDDLVEDLEDNDDLVDEYFGFRREE